MFHSGISYDKPLPPIQVASQRADRIAKEKKVCVCVCVHDLDHVEGVSSVLLLYELPSRKAVGLSDVVMSVLSSLS